MDRLPRVLIVTGTPGVGKTRISKVLAERLEGLYISLTDIVKRENLCLYVDSERDTVVADLRVLSDRVSEIISESSCDVVVDGHYASEVVSSEMVSYAFVLRVEPDKLRCRLQERGYSEGKILENLASEVLDVCLFDAVACYGVEKVDEIEVTDKNVDEVIDEILGVINGRTKAKSGKVDWLGKLEEEDRLSELSEYLNWL
ncbi:MAG: adenylate kinase family protein [Candidatus Bathyarchaeia archaeon]